MINASWIKKLRVRRINCTRLIASLFYFFCGIVLVYFSTNKFEKLTGFFTLNKVTIFWCSGWSAIGIAAGLWNSRDDNTPVTRKKCHYFIYFFFILFIASLAAFVVFLSVANNHLAYASSALVAIVAGFAGDKLAGDIFKLK